MLRKLHDQELGVETDHQVRQLKNVGGMVGWSIAAPPPPQWPGSTILTIVIGSATSVVSHGQSSGSRYAGY
jgi:hypothetical protein